MLPHMKMPLLRATLLIALCAASQTRAQMAAESSPPVEAAREALAEAGRATGAENPAEAGASYAPRPVAPIVRAEQPVRVETPPPPPPPPPAPPPEPPAEAPVPIVPVAGPWRVQLGAFAVSGNAERLWSRLANRPELAGRERLLVPSGRVTLLLAGGYPTRTAAESACRTLRQARQDCLVTRG